jgi:DNA polymerase III delta prime subunit
MSETRHLSPLCRPANYKANWKKPGKDGSGSFAAVLISGPPGIGKTTSAHLVAKLKGYSPIELNASDARSKKLIQVCQHKATGQVPSGLTFPVRTLQMSTMRRSTGGSQGVVSR